MHNYEQLQTAKGRKQSLLEMTTSIQAVDLKSTIFSLKQSQYKNDATQLKNFLGSKLPPFFLRRVGDAKKAVISKSRSISTESRRSYID